jgi:hypothetical protein
MFCILFCIAPVTDPFGLCSYDLDKLASRVCNLMQVEPAELWAPDKGRKRVAARSLLCYWAGRNLGIGMAQTVRRLNLSFHKPKTLNMEM